MTPLFTCGTFRTVQSDARSKVTRPQCQAWRFRLTERHWLPRNGAPVKLWDVATGTLAGDLDTRSKAHAVAFSPDGRQLAIGTEYWVWTYDVAFAPDGRALASGDYRGASYSGVLPEKRTYWRPALLELVWAAG